MVLLRRVDASGFGFFTNYQSRKGREPLVNSQAALCAYWPWLDEQARIEARYRRRPRRVRRGLRRPAARKPGRRLGSAQSEVLASRADLEARYHAVDAEDEGRAIPRPPHWGGFRLLPERIEFWRACTYRLHDRMVYIRDGDGWRTEVLYP